MEKYGDINNLLSEINDQSSDENTKIINEASEYGKSKIKQAKRDSIIRKRRIIKDTEKKASLITQKELSNLRLEINRMKLNKQQEVIDQIKSIINDKAGKLKKDKDYPALIKKLFVEAIDILQEKNIEVVFDINDKKAAEEKIINMLFDAAKDRKVNFTKSSVIYQEGVNSGIIVRVIDKKIIYNNTIDAKLKRFEREINYDIYKDLFLCK